MQMRTRNSIAIVFGSPVGDVVTLLRAVLALSPASCVKEIHMPATGDTQV